MLNRLPRTLSLIALCASVVLSQQPAPRNQDEPLKVSTAVVQLDVIVTDKTGRRVTGLAASDFQIADDGAPRPVDYFSVIESSRVVPQKDAPAPTAPAAAAPPSTLTIPYPARHIALVIDDLNLSPENFTRARRALADYVSAQLSANDMVALVSTGGSLASLQQFTNDRQRVLSAISRIAAQSPRANQLSDLKFKLSAAEAARIDAGDEAVLEAVARRMSTQSLADQATTGTIADQTAVGTRRGGGGDTDAAANSLKSADIARARIRTMARGRVSEVSAESRHTLATLANLFRAMAELPGRKIAVMLTESFTTLGGTSEDQSNQLLQLIDLARRSGISVYGLDAGGLRTNTIQASEYTTGAGMRAAELSGSNTNFSDFEKLGALRQLVTGTGGALFANTNDISGGLQRAVEDASSYYVVGFTPSKLDNRFHPITITVKGRRDLVVRTRRGYLAVNEETVQGTNTELAAALISPIPRIDLPVEVVANAVPQGAEQVVVTGLHVGRNYLQLPAATAADQTAAYEVVAWVFGAGRDEPAGVIKRTLTYDLSKPEERQKLKTSGVVFVPQQFKLAPGVYQIRVAMREKASGAVGSAYQFFEVPDVQDKKSVSVSSALVTPAGQTGFNGANSFAPGAEIDLRFIVYNPPKETAELTQRVRLLDSQGRALLDSPLTLVAPPANNPSMALQSTRFKLPPARGRYALIVNLTDKKGKVDVERRADLVVE